MTDLDKLLAEVDTIKHRLGIIDQQLDMIGRFAFQSKEQKEADKIAMLECKLILIKDSITKTLDK